MEITERSDGSSALAIPISFEPAAPSNAPLSSDLSDVAMTDPADPSNDNDNDNDMEPPPTLQDGDQPQAAAPQFSASTEQIVARVTANAANAANAANNTTPGWEAAKEQLMKDMAISDQFAAPTLPAESGVANKRGGGRGRGVKRASFAADATPTHGEIADGKAESDATPRARGRGRGGRPRGRGRRGSGRGGRGGKRKRDDDDDEDEDGDASDSSSEIFTPVTTTTKSGRSIQKPTTFVPPLAPVSPAVAGGPQSKRRRRAYRRNPESAVCKSCLRGASPASNMIVFCDGCNTPYHRFCHHPPIDQKVVDELDKEWFCRLCERERMVLPVPEAEVESFVGLPEGVVSVDERRDFFASLPSGMLVTLLTRASTLRPDLPLFPPDFMAKRHVITITPPNSHGPINGHAHPIPMQQSAAAPAAPAPAPPQPQPSVSHGLPLPAPVEPSHLLVADHHHTNNADEKNDDDNEDDDAYYGPDEHPPHYPQPGQGLMKTLPPEQQDLGYLVDEQDEFGVFAHVYRVDGGGPGEGGSQGGGAG